MSACPIFDRVTMLGSNLDFSAKLTRSSNTEVSLSNGSNISDPLDSGGGGSHGLERDYYGCYCLKFIVKNGTHITEERVLEDFGQYGDVVDIRGPGLFSGLRGNHVYVRFIDKSDAEEALRHLSSKYHQLTPASISDVLPDNYGLYTISFYNKTGIPSSDVRREFSKFGEVKNLTGSLDVKGGRVFVSYKEKNSAVQALQAFFFRKDRYPNMKFALPRCEKDYFGCYCLKFYNKSGDVTEDKVCKDFGQFGDVVDVRGPGLFDVTGDDVYVRYKDKSSAEQALIELVGKYDSLCLAPPSDIQADKFGYFTITFVNDKCLSKSDVWYIFSKFGTVACVNGTFDCKKGRVFVSYKDKQGALNALETMLITKEYHLQVSKNSTVRKNDYNMIVTSRGDTSSEMESQESHGPENSRKEKRSSPSRERIRESKESLSPSSLCSAVSSISSPPSASLLLSKGNGLIKFNRNVEKDIFGYYCLSFLNEDGDINEKKVRHDFSKFGDVVSVRGALGKQKGHVFVRFRRKEAAENCLNCLNSFPLSEMSELFGKYLFLSPATPRDIDCDMYGLYSISFLNLNMKTFREIRSDFTKFGEIVKLTSGGTGNTDELVSISYADKNAAIKALQTHFTNKEFPYLDIAKGSSLLLVDSSDSSDNEDEYIHHHHHHRRRDPFHDPPTKNGQGDVVDELLKPFQSYFRIYRTGQYSHPFSSHEEVPSNTEDGSPIHGRANAVTTNQPLSPSASSSTTTNNSLSVGVSKSPMSPHSDSKKYRIKKNKSEVRGEVKVEDGEESNVGVVLPEKRESLTNVSMDIFGYYTLSFRYTKEFNERKLRSEFYSAVKIRSISNDVVLASFESREGAESLLRNPSVITKYPSLSPASKLSVKPDKDGFYSIEFINSGMSGIREITNEFSKQGEVMKVQQGGAKNAVKRVTVSYSRKKSALCAVSAHKDSKDFLSLDFSRDCIFEKYDEDIDDDTDDDIDE